MTPQREEPGADHWQDEPPFPVVPERNFAAQRMTLRVLLIAAIVLPCLYIAVMSWSDLKAREAEAAEMVDRNAHVAEEHALKVFDMNETLNARVIDLIEGEDDDTLRGEELDIHNKLVAMGGGYPQMASVSIIGADGRLIATSRIYPAPDVSIETRDDFVGIRDNKMFETSRA